MTILDLMQSINNNTVPHFLVFYGEEYTVMNIYIKKILELGFAANLRDTTLYCANDTNKKSLVNNKKCYIVTDDNDFLKQENKWEQVKDTFEQSKNILILKYTNLDKRSKFYKTLQDHIIEFEPLTDNVLLNYIGNKYDEDISLDLIHICNNNYGRILLELDKVEQYKCGNKLKSYTDILKQFISDGTIHQDIGDITFLLTDAIVVGDLDRSNKYLYQAKLKNEPTIMVLSILYDNFKDMLIIQGLGSQKPTPENTGIQNTGKIWAIKKKCGGYSNKELLRNLKIIREVEVGIKSGTIDESIALDYTVLNILR